MIAHGKIVLRAPEPADVDAMFRWENDRSIWAYGRTRAPLSRFQLHEYVRNYPADPIADGQARFIIEWNGEAAGCIDLYALDAVNRRAGVGVVVDTPYRGNGLALDALVALCGYMSADLGFHQLWAIVGVENISSRRLFESAGFSTSGRLRSWIRRGESYSDALVYQILLPADR